MLKWLFICCIFISCQDKEVAPKSPPIKEPATRKSPYQHFEVMGPLKGIEFKRIKSDSDSSMQYAVSLLIEGKEIIPSLKEIPAPLLVSGSPGVLRVAISDLPTVMKKNIDADKRLTAVGPDNSPYSLLRATEWGRYSVGKTVSVGVIYTGGKRGSTSDP